MNTNQTETGEGNAPRVDDREQGDSVDLITVAKQISAFEFTSQDYQAALKELVQIKRNARIALKNRPEPKPDEDQPSSSRKKSTAA